MITAKELYLFFSVKDNLDFFREFNPYFKLTYKQLFKDFPLWNKTKYTDEDFKKWISFVGQYINLAVVVDFYEKCKSNEV